MSLGPRVRAGAGMRTRQRPEDQMGAVKREAARGMGPLRVKTREGVRMSRNGSIKVLRMGSKP